MKKYFLFISILSAVAILNNSCKKDSGQGGRASIKGRIYAVNYNNTLLTALDSGYIGGQKVYIIYGDDVAVGDNQDTNNDGSFEFTYLRQGKYKVYTFSKNKSNHLDSAVIQTGEITSRKQILELPDFRIKTNKN
ncbi:MAG: hypothetical protein HY840_14430 [Bacteroidetes bacterium]|nr:hypothetical protein [Bacteroidota bacterium]